jgi:hypothetical protein
MDNTRINKLCDEIKQFISRFIKENMVFPVKNNKLDYCLRINEIIFNIINKIELSDEIVEGIINLILEYIPIKTLLNDINFCYKKRFWNKIKTKKQLIDFFKKEYSTLTILTDPLHGILSSPLSNPTDYYLYNGISKQIKRTIINANSIHQYIYECLNYLS